MKKAKYTLALVALLITSVALGQTHFGIKTGVSITNPKTDLVIDAIDQAPRSYTSFVVGGLAEIGINEHLAFQPEVLYTRKGFNIDQGTSFDVGGMNIPIGAKLETSVSYLETPLLLKGKFGEGATKFYGIAGPALGYGLSGKIDPKVTLLIDFNLPSQPLNLDSDMYQRLELSGIVGAGVEHNVTSGKVFADLRYQYGFTNLMEDPIADISIRNTGVQFAVGYSHAF